MRVALVFSHSKFALVCRSRGRITLRSDDPYDAPRLDPRYLTDAEGADLKTLRYPDTSLSICYCGPIVTFEVYHHVSPVLSNTLHVH